MFYSGVNAQVSKQALSTETQIRLERVPEFKFIQEEADKLGVKVYLFGGTASAFAHYVRWDLEREAGDEKYQAERFDYDFTNIYRGNQDLDIVVDGTAEQAAALQQILKKEYPHFVGSKEAWEVRLLRAEIGDKLPLLDNPDFLNQHTDTNSTGMIAVNADPGEIIFRDLFSWENPDSVFLNDVAAGRIKFLFSESHETTSRFKNGQNPPVFAAIRYLAKLAQYEVDEAEGDLEIIKKIIEGTNWKKVRGNSYVKHKLEEFGKKVLLNAPDSEYAWNLLEETGLRKRLIEMDGNQESHQDTLSWWMNKEPLRTKSLGEGGGRTAAEIFKNHINEDGEIVVAHETNSFEAYENITRSSHGAANAFISRRGISGEAAAYGDGFYTRLGEKGARGTNLTIRFKLNSNAREGEDFIYSGDFIILKNKAAIELIQEDLNISMVDFLKLTISNSLSLSNKGLTEKLIRKFARQSSNSNEFLDAKGFVKSYFFIASDFPEEITFDEAELIKIDNFDDLYKFFINTKTMLFDGKISSYFKKNVKELKREWIEALIEKGGFEQVLVESVLSEEPWIEDVDLVKMFIRKGTAGDSLIASKILVHEKFIDHTDVLEDFVAVYGSEVNLIKYVFPLEHWVKRPELLEKIVDEGKYDRLVINHVLTKKHWSGRSDWVWTFLKRGKLDAAIVSEIMQREFWCCDAKMLEHIIDNNKDLDDQIISLVLSNKGWSDHLRLLRKIVERGSYSVGALIHNIASKTYWSLPKDLLKTIFKEVISSWNTDNIYAFIENVISQEQYIDQVDILKSIYNLRSDFANIKLEDALRRLLTHVFSTPHWAKVKEAQVIVEDIVKKSFKAIPNTSAYFHDREIAKYILSQKHWSHREDWLKKIFELGRAKSELIKYVLSQEHWSHLAEDMLIKLNVTQEDTTAVNQYVLSQKHSVKFKKLIDDIIDESTYFALTNFVSTVLGQEHWLEHPEVAHKVLDRDIVLPLIELAFARSVLPNAGNKPGYKEIAERLIDENGIKVHLQLIESTLWRPSWSEHGYLIEKLINKIRNDGKNSKIADALIDHIFSKNWNHSGLLLKFYERVNEETKDKIFEKVILVSDWSQNSRLFLNFIKLQNDKMSLTSVTYKLLEQDQFLKNQDLVEELIITLLRKKSEHLTGSVGRNILVSNKISLDSMLKLIDHKVLNRDFWDTAILPRKLWSDRDKKRIESFFNIDEISTAKLQEFFNSEESSEIDFLEPFSCQKILAF